MQGLRSFVFAVVFVVIGLVAVTAIPSLARAAEPNPLTPAVAGDGRVRVDLRSSKHDFPVGLDRPGDDGVLPRPLCTTPCTLWLPIGTRPLRIFDPEPNLTGNWRSMGLRLSVNGMTEVGIRPGRPRRFQTGGWVVAASMIVAAVGAGLLGFELASEKPRDAVWISGAAVGGAGIAGAIAGIAVILTSFPSIQWSKRP